MALRAEPFFCEPTTFRFESPKAISTTTMSASHQTSVHVVSTGGLELLNRLKVIMAVLGKNDVMAMVMVIHGDDDGVRMMAMW